MFIPSELRESGGPGIRDDVDIGFRQILRKHDGSRLAHRQNRIGDAVAEKQIARMHQPGVFRNAHQNVIAFEHVDLKPLLLCQLDIFLKGRVL